MIALKARGLQIQIHDEVQPNWKSVVALQRTVEALLSVFEFENISLMTYAEILTEVENFINANTDRQHRTFSRGMLLQLMAKYHQQKLQQCHVIGSADILPLKDEVKSEVKRLWALPPDYNSSPKVAAVKLVQQFYRDNGVECGIKKAKEVIEQHCL